MLIAASFIEIFMISLLGSGSLGIKRKSPSTCLRSKRIQGSDEAVCFVYDDAGQRACTDVAA